MLGFMVVKPKKDFIPMKTNLGIISIISVFSLFSCDDSRQVTENIPRGLVNTVLDLNLASNMHLNNVGTFSYIDGGVRGVLIIHDYDDTWYAFERTCAYEPTNSCSKIWVDTANIQLKCGTYQGNTFSPCCESTYMFSGFPSKGPAAGRLAQYYITRSGNILQVYN
jgi:hypothetical protein